MRPTRPPQPILQPSHPCAALLAACPCPLECYRWPDTTDALHNVPTEYRAFHRGNIDRYCAHAKWRLEGVLQVSILSPNTSTFVAWQRPGNGRLYRRNRAGFCSMAYRSGLSGRGQGLLPWVVCVWSNRLRLWVSLPDSWLLTSLGFGRAATSLPHFVEAITFLACMGYIGCAGCGFARGTR